MSYPLPTPSAVDIFPEAQVRRSNPLSGISLRFQADTEWPNRYTLRYFSIDQARRRVIDQHFTDNVHKRFDWTPKGGSSAVKVCYVGRPDVTPRSSRSFDVTVTLREEPA